MYNLEVVVLEFLVPSGGSSCQFLGFFPICQVLVVGLDDEGFFRPYEVGSPIFDRFDDR
jgi:hypothetical protein